MRENRFLDVLAGVILGVIFGTIYFGIPAKCLIAGTIPVEGLMLPEGVNSAILMQSFRCGGFIGGIIGFLGGLSVPVTMPRGHMAKCVSCNSFLFCTIAAFVMYGSQLLHMEAWKIAATFFYILFGFMISIPMGDMFSFVEKIRE